MDRAVEAVEGTAPTMSDESMLVAWRRGGFVEVFVDQETEGDCTVETTESR